MNAEVRLESAKHMNRKTSTINRNFLPNHVDIEIDDDHKPFLQRGVPVLFLISLPPPDVWQRITDNRDVVDITTVENLNKGLRNFVVEYLHVQL